MNMKTRVVEAALERKGFKKTEGDHSFFIFHNENGVKTLVKTKTSHGSRDLDDFLVGKMAKQCKLTKRDFLRLIECTLSHEEYEEMLRNGGYIQAPQSTES